MKSYLLFLGLFLSIRAENKIAAKNAEKRSDIEKQEYDVSSGSPAVYYKVTPSFAQKNSQIPDNFFNYNPQVASYSPQVVSYVPQQNVKYASPQIPAHIMYGFAPQVQQQLQYGAQPVPYSQPAKSAPSEVRNNFHAATGPEFYFLPASEASSFQYSSALPTYSNPGINSQLFGKFGLDDNAARVDQESKTVALNKLLSEHVSTNLPLYVPTQRNAITQELIHQMTSSHEPRQLRFRYETQLPSKVFSATDMYEIASRPSSSRLQQHVTYFPWQFGSLVNAHGSVPEINFSPASEVSTFRFSSPLVTYSNQGVLSQYTGKLASGDNGVHVSQETQAATPKKVSAAAPQTVSYSPASQYTHNTVPQPKHEHVLTPQEHIYSVAPQQQFSYAVAPSKAAYAVQQSQAGATKETYSSLPKQYYAVLPQQVAYSPQQLGYSSQQVGHSPQQVAYSPQHVGHSPQQVAYSPQQVGYSPSDLQQYAYVLAAPQSTRTVAQPVYATQSQGKYTNTAETYNQ